MEKVQSRDGTRIAFDRTGQGDPVILVSGAFGYRAFPMLVKIAAELSKHFTVINYDRRGRKDSGDTPPYAVEREIEDLAAVIEASGGSAYVWGLSSGAVLSMRAAAAGLDIRRLALYQPPFLIDRDGPLPPADFGARLDNLVAAERRTEAAKYFMVKGMGAPAIAINLMRLMPFWSNLKELAHTLPYDYAIMGDTVSGRPLVAEEWADVKVPTLVMAGSKAPARVRDAAKATAAVLPDARYRSLPGQSHNVAAGVLAPVLVDFFTTDARTPR